MRRYEATTTKDVNNAEVKNPAWDEQIYYPLPFCSLLEVGLSCFTVEQVAYDC